MKVFISWSGTLSHKVAVILRDWIPSVIQSVNPYVSSEDIDKGARWSTDIAEELQGAKYGILCLVPDNLQAPWLNFEAGALSKTMIDNYVSPFLLGLKPTEVKGPLVQFQATTYTEEDIKKLIYGINDANADNKIEKERLSSYFDVWWPKLKESLDAIEVEIKSAKKGTKKVEPKSPEKDSSSNELLEEILSLVRNQQRILKSPEEIMPRGYFREILEMENRRSKGKAQVHPGAIEDLQQGIRDLEKIVRFDPDMDQPEMFMKIEKAFDRIRRSSDHIIERVQHERW